MTVIFFLLTSTAFAANSAILVGGSGESKAFNQFKDEFVNFQTGLNKRGWKTESFFSSGADVTNSKAAEPASVKEAIAQALKSAKTGDQVLLYFNTHGFPAKPDQKAHSVLLENGQALNLDELDPLLKEAEHRGVRLGLMDLSCFSGSSQALASKKNCVLSLSSIDYFGFSSSNQTISFSSEVVKLPTEEKTEISLKDQFLSARKKDSTSNFPLLSSTFPIGGVEGWSNLFYKFDPANIKRHNKQILALTGQPFLDADDLFGGVGEEIEIKGLKCKDVVDHILDNVDQLIRDILKINIHVKLEQFQELKRFRGELENELRQAQKDYKALSSIALKINLAYAHARDLRDLIRRPDRTLTLIEESPEYKASIEEIKNFEEEYAKKEAAFNKSIAAVISKERVLYDKFQSFIREKSDLGDPCHEFKL